MPCRQPLRPRTGLSRVAHRRRQIQDIVGPDIFHRVESIEGAASAFAGCLIAATLQPLGSAVLPELHVHAVAFKGLSHRTMAGIGTGGTDEPAFLFIPRLSLDQIDGVCLHVQESAIWAICMHISSMCTGLQRLTSINVCITCSELQFFGTCHAPIGMLVCRSEVYTESSSCRPQTAGARQSWQALSAFDA